MRNLKLEEKQSVLGGARAIQRPVIITADKKIILEQNQIPNNTEFMVLNGFVIFNNRGQIMYFTQNPTEAEQMVTSLNKVGI